MCLFIYYLKLNTVNELAKINSHHIILSFFISLEFFYLLIYILSIQDKNMSIKILSANKKAGFEYEIIQRLEAGMVLAGTEVKSLRDGKCSLQEGYVIEDDNEIFVKNITIPEYNKGNITNHDPLRLRKLLLHKKEITFLKKSIKEKGITLIPLKIYLKGHKIKLEIGLCKGKKLHDKRDSIKERDIKRDLDQHKKRDF